MMMLFSALLLLCFFSLSVAFVFEAFLCLFFFRSFVVVVWVWGSCSPFEPFLSSTPCPSFSCSLFPRSPHTISIRITCDQLSVCDETSQDWVWEYDLFSFLWFFSVALQRGKENQEKQNREKQEEGRSNDRQRKRRMKGWLLEVWTFFLVLSFFLGLFLESSSSSSCHHFHCLWSFFLEIEWKNFTCTLKETPTKQQKHTQTDNIKEKSHPTDKPTNTLSPLLLCFWLRSIMLDFFLFLFVLALGRRKRSGRRDSNRNWCTRSKRRRGRWNWSCWGRSGRRECRRRRRKILCRRFHLCCLSFLFLLFWRRRRGRGHSSTNRCRRRRKQRGRRSSSRRGRTRSREGRRRSGNFSSSSASMKTAEPAKPIGDDEGVDEVDEGGGRSTDIFLFLFLFFQLKAQWEQQKEETVLLTERRGQQGQEEEESKEEQQQKREKLRSRKTRKQKQEGLMMEPICPFFDFFWGGERESCLKQCCRKHCEREGEGEERKERREEKEKEKEKESK